MNTQASQRLTGRNQVVAALLSAQKAAALDGAVRDAVTVRGKWTRGRSGLAQASRQTIASMAGAGLLKPRDLYPEEWVATDLGVTVAAQHGLATKFAGDVPAPRVRAFILRGLTMPNVWAVGDREAYMPRRLRCDAHRDCRWIEELGYGTFERASDPRYGTYAVLTLSAKGSALVTATDEPVTLRLSACEEESLRAGRMKFGILPDPCKATLVNFQIESDSMDSPRHLYARMFDPAALFPGTEIRLLNESSGVRIGTARAGAWNRLQLCLLPAYAKGSSENGWHFDACFQYPDEVAHDQSERRVWAPFPEDYSNESVRPKQHELRFAHDCGFPDLKSMRKVWLKRAEKGKAAVGSGMRGWIYGLIVELDAVDWHASQGRSSKGAQSPAVLER